MQVEVVYLSKEKQIHLQLEVAPGSTLHQVLKQSGILVQCPELDIRYLSVGVFSKPKQLSDVVMPEDRIEIYRPLECDPKAMRRAKHTGPLNLKRGSTHDT